MENYEFITGRGGTVVLENDLIAQSFPPAISSRPKAKTSYIIKLHVLAKIYNAEFFAQKKNLTISIRNNIPFQNFFKDQVFTKLWHNFHLTFQ